MDDGRVVHRGAMAALAADAACSTRCSACRSRRTPEDERHERVPAATASAAAPAAAEALPQTRFDLLPLRAGGGARAGGLARWSARRSTWLTLTFAGLAMGMIIFITASGLTLVFGLMDVLNFGHSLFIALGAYIATSVFGRDGRLDQRRQPRAQPRRGRAWRCSRRCCSAGAFGLGFERVIVRPVYGQHLKQILVTIGGAIVGEELIKVVWGPAQIPLPLPEALRGSVLVGDAAVEKFRLVAVAVGVVVLLALLWR